MSCLVYERLRDAITSLKLSPGARISENEVCRRFGASRTPVREAFRRLQREGLLAAVEQPRSVTRLIVAPLTAKDMQQLFLMVGALDGIGARLAARLPDRDRHELVGRLESLNNELREMAQGVVPADVRHAELLDLAFHRAYQTAADAPQLLEELDSLAARRTRYVRVYTEALIQSHNLRDSVAEHEAIIEAVGVGDGEAAERRAGFNHRNALERFGRALNKAGERGNWFEDLAG
ncbi:MAG: GntR family transcriptional regulator [Vicinamibacterales bacterium]